MEKEKIKRASDARQRLLYMRGWREGQAWFSFPFGSFLVLKFNEDTKGRGRGAYEVFFGCPSNADIITAI